MTTQIDTSATQTHTHRELDENDPNLGSKLTLNNQMGLESSWADRLVWLGYHPYEVMVAGSSPARPTIGENLAFLD
jgi:hypothetical protein